MAGGSELQEAFEKQLEGQPAVCRECKQSGFIGQDLQIAYTESGGPLGWSYYITAICPECEKKVILPDMKKAKKK